MPSESPSLQKQLDDQRFLHAVSYVQQASGSIKKLSSSELLHLNEILTNRSPDNQMTPEEPWRVESTKVKIPGGEVVLNVLSNPLSRAREITGDAQQLLNVPIGNLRDPQEMAAFRIRIGSLILPPRAN